MIKRALLALALATTLSLPLVAEEPLVITWDTLRTLNYETGQVPDVIKQLDGKTIEIAGFIVPMVLEDSIDKISEFMLVPDPMACLHVPPPPPNQMIYVKMNKALPLDMDFRGIRIQGKLSVPNPKTVYGDVSYEIIGLAAKESKIKIKPDPLQMLIQHDTPN